jgi:three-Cys-motif partner protein
MPVFVGQGQSAATEAKERGLGAAFATNLRIFNSRFGNDRRAIYMHFDLNCGSGTNEEVGCDGSPIAFLHAARRADVQRYMASFIDRDTKAVKDLLACKEVSEDDRCFVHHGDNGEYIDVIPDIISNRRERPEFAIGSVLCDPNGTDIPVARLAQLSVACPRLDIFLNWNSAAYKRQRGAKGTLRDAVDAIGKKHWLIRAPLGIHQFTVLIGRNVAVNDHKSEGFYHLQSERGQEIFDRCNLTRGEFQENAIRGQGKLFAA